MKKEIRYYQIIPSVVPANKETEVEIQCFEPYYGFKDGITYGVVITPYSIPKKPFTDKYILSDVGDNADKLFVIAQDGKLRFSYFFNGEQKWRVRVYATEPTNDNPMIKKYGGYWYSHSVAAQNGCTLEMYSVEEDLYTLRPYKGDLHLHTSMSDGIETPQTTAANYRKAGYDFIAITDHHVYESSAIAREAFADVKTNFIIYNGEEVHSDYIGQLHIVNFDSQSSVNKRILEDRANVLKEIEEIKSRLNCFDKVDIAWRIWAYKAIKQSGGLAIMAHPYWDIFKAVVSDETINYLFENKLFDVLEVLGGVNHADNNMQALLYHDMKGKGMEYPIVGSTDSHSSLEYGVERFAIAYTVAFAESTSSVRRAIERGYTVAVQNEKGQQPNVIGGLRLARYTRFLMENYFPLHDEFCFTAGMMMRKYYLEKNVAAKQICERTEEYIQRFEYSFFGKNSME